jgi:hypothetical protein
MTNSVTNQIWLEQVGKQWGIPPEALLNGIVRMLRERDESGIQKIEDWLSAGEQALQQSRVLLEETRGSRCIVDEAVNAVRFYVLHLEEERKKASAGPT